MDVAITKALPQAWHKKGPMKNRRVAKDRDDQLCCIPFGF